MTNQIEQAAKPTIVLIAVCDEIFGRAMVEFMQRHSWSTQTQFHLLYAIEPNPLKNHLILNQQEIDQLSQDEEDSAESVLNAVAGLMYEFVPSTNVQRHIVRGDAKHEIVKFANELPADLLVMGSHGRKGLKKLILGSVASSVVVESPCSSLLIKLTRDQIEKAEEFELSLEDLPAEMRGLYAADDEAVSGRV